jgi:hypothetical protein
MSVHIPVNPCLCLSNKDFLLSKADGLYLGRAEEHVRDRLVSELHALSPLLNQEETGTLGCGLPVRRSAAILHAFTVPEAGLCRPLLSGLPEVPSRASPPRGGGGGFEDFPQFDRVAGSQRRAEAHLPMFFMDNSSRMCSGCEFFRGRPASV